MYVWSEETRGLKEIMGSLEGAGLVQGITRHFMRLECEGVRGGDSRRDWGRPVGRSRIFLLLRTMRDPERL